MRAEFRGDAASDGLTRTFGVHVSPLWGFGSLIEGAIIRRDGIMLTLICLKPAFSSRSLADFTAWKASTS